MSKQYNVNKELPEVGRMVVVETKYKLLFIGYLDNSKKQFKCILRSELQDNGDFSQYYGAILTSYIKYWFYYDE